MFSKKNIFNNSFVNYNHIHDFRFIRKDDMKDEKWLHWSRIYEWTMVLDYIKKYSPLKVHNTSCGGLNDGDCLHLTFCKEIDVLCNKTIHSDIWGTYGAPQKPDSENFIYYDITTPYPNDEQFDMVINISTLEELQNQEEREKAFLNLYSQVKKGGTLFLTFDYPDVDLQWLESKLGLSVKRSFFKKIYDRKKGLSVILLIISK